MALEVGKIFYAEKETIAYRYLGIGRLIYQLPMSLCEMFIHEVFGDEIPDIFNEETTTTIQKFFENNLNISETARQLYVHRNTALVIAACLCHFFLPFPAKSIPYLPDNLCICFKFLSLIRILTFRILHM